MRFINSAKIDSKTLGISDNVASFRVKRLESSPVHETLDNIAGATDDQEFYLGFQKMVAYELVKVEREALQTEKQGWIEVFFDFLYHYLKEPILNDDAVLY